MPRTAPVRMCALRMHGAQDRQRCLRLNRTWHNLYLACEDSPQRAFFFCTFSCSRLALLASTVTWLRCFLFLNASNHRLHSVLDSAKCVRCGGLTALSYPSSVVKKRHSSLSSMSRPGIRYSPILCHCMWRMRSSACTWVQSDIPEHDSHVRTCIHTCIRTYIHCENRYLIQSLVLMYSAIISATTILIISYHYYCKYTACMIV